jgi:hypothetical protein
MAFRHKDVSKGLNGEKNIGATDRRTFSKSQTQWVRSLPVGVQTVNYGRRSLTLAIAVTALLCAASARGDGTGSEKSSIESYSQLAHLGPLVDGGPDEMRIWFTDAMIVYEVRGYVVTASGITRCVLPQRVNSKYDAVEYGKSKCISANNPRRASELLSLLPILKDTQFKECDVLDGYGADVAAVLNKERFSLSLSNPDACNDVFKRINDILSKWHAP